MSMAAKTGHEYRFRVSAGDAWVYRDRLTAAEVSGSANPLSGASPSGPRLTAASV
jgi:hypothetical protein